MKKYAILKTFEEMTKEDYRRYSDSLDKFDCSSNQDLEIVEEFDDLEEAEEYFELIKPVLREMGFAVKYFYSEIYQLVERYEDEYGDIYDNILKIKYGDEDGPYQEYEDEDEEYEDEEEEE